MATAIQIQVENIKSGGREKSIFRGLPPTAGLSDIVIDRDSQTVSCTATDALRQVGVEKLRFIGYLGKGTLADFAAGLANGTSFVSCPIGRGS